MRKLRVACLAAVFFGIGPLWAESRPDELVTAAQATLNHFETDQDVSWFRDHVGEAKALMIAPKIVKAGFVVGGSGGHAVLLHRDAETGKWSGPAFYSLVAASVGFQAGVEVSELVTLVMTEKGLNAMLGSSFKIGGDVSVAAGPVGAGAKSNVIVDLVTFTRAKGVYGGLDLEGTVVKVDTSANEAYYQKRVLPTDILIRPQVSNEKSEALRAMIERIASAHTKHVADK